MPPPAEEERLLASVARVRRLFSVGLGVMAVLWVIVIPAADVWRRYRHARLEGEIRLGLVADRISSFVAANLETWEFEDVRLPSLVAGAQRGAGIQPSRLALLTRSGEVNEFPVNGRRGMFILTLEDQVTDGRNPVGRVVMDLPLDEALAPAAVSAGLGLASMVLLLWLARMVGRKALDRSLAAIGDVTARLASRVEELEEARRRLAEHSVNLRMANEDITHVALLTTHHLREPLRTILSYAQLLVRRGEGMEGDETTASHLAFLKGGVERMQTQMKALAHYLGLREREMSFDMVSLYDAVRIAVDAMADDARPEVECGDLPTLVCDAELLVRLFSDLFEHARRHRRDGENVRVTVDAELLGDMWEIRFADDGVPLAGRDPDRMFHLLVHGEGGHMVEGLAAARLIAFLLGGSMWADHGARGAAIRFTLPARRPGGG